MVIMLVIKVVPRETNSATKTKFMAKRVKTINDTFRIYCVEVEIIISSWIFNLKREIKDKVTV